MSALNKSLDIAPAWDRRHSDPRKNYGVSGVEMRFYLTGPEGAVQFLLHTNWQLPNVTREQEETSTTPEHVRALMRPCPMDLGYHSRVPMHEGHTPIGMACSVLGTDTCYYDGSNMMAKTAFNKLLTGGYKALDQYMLEFYNSTFSTSYTSIQEEASKQSG